MIPWASDFDPIHEEHEKVGKRNFLLGPAGLAIIALAVALLAVGLNHPTSGGVVAAFLFGAGLVAAQDRPGESAGRPCRQQPRSEPCLPGCGRESHLLSALREEGEGSVVVHIPVRSRWSSRAARRLCVEGVAFVVEFFQAQPRSIKAAHNPSLD